MTEEPTLIDAIRRDCARIVNVVTGRTDAFSDSTRYPRLRMIAGAARFVMLALILWKVWQIAEMTRVLQLKGG